MNKPSLGYILHAGFAAVLAALALGSRDKIRDHVKCMWIDALVSVRRSSWMHVEPNTVVPPNSSLDRIQLSLGSPPPLNGLENFVQLLDVGRCSFNAYSQGISCEW